MTDAKDTSKPDFGSGVPLRDLPDGGMVLGRVDAEDVILVRRGDEFFAVGAHCTHYHGPLAEGLIVGRHRALPLAPRVFQSAHRRSAARARRWIRSPAGGSSGWATPSSSGRSSPSRTRRRGRPAKSPAASRFGRDRRRRRRRPGRRGHAPSRRLRRASDDDQRGRLPAVRPTESLEGFPRGHGARRLDSAAIARVLHRAADRPRARFARVVARRRQRSASRSRTARHTRSARS